MRAVKSKSASENASTGFIKRGVPIMPSDTVPPLIGMLTIKDLLIFCNITIVLRIKTTVSPVKINHSFLEKEEKAKLTSFLEGNFKLRIEPKKFSIDRNINRKSFSYSLLLL